MIDESLYEGREQTYVKHYILSEYLDLFSQIIGARWPKINYVDCFAGPWESRAEDMRDTSFGIAVNQFRKARELLRTRGHATAFRCFFLESGARAYRQLREFANRTADISVTTLNEELENAIEPILRFIRDGGPDAFTFTFIDPTGWTGFAMDRIRPILAVTPGEVLINFMTGFIKRFVEAPADQTAESFVAMFGEDIRDELKGLQPLEREERLVALYMRNVKRAGNFDFVAAAVVFKPGIESTHFHLIYATRNRKGVEVFKNVEKRAMDEMDDVRAVSKQRREIARTGQSFLLPAKEWHSSRELAERRKSHERQARNLVWSAIRQQRRVLYDNLWTDVMAVPLVNDRILKEWLEEWSLGNRIKFDGFEVRQKKPRCDSNNYIIWKSD